MSVSEPCVVCGQERSAHHWTNPLACSEWRTIADLQEQIEHGFDDEAPDWSND